MIRSKCSTMRRGWIRIAVVSLGVCVAIGAAPAFGDDSDASDDAVTAPAKAPKQGKQQRPARRGMRDSGASPDRMLAHMTKELSLTEKQQSQVKEILEAQKVKRDALRKGGAKEGGREEAFRKMKEIRTETNGQIEAVLDDAQREKFTAMMEKRQKRFEEWRGGARGPMGAGGGKAPAKSK